MKNTTKIILLVALFVASWGTTVIGADYSTSYTYDSMGRIISVANSNGTWTNFAYDSNGNRTVASSSPGIATPSVVAVSPTDGSNDAPITTTVMATVSKSVDPTTVTPGTFYVTGPSGLVAGIASVYDLELVFVPASSLQYGSTYTATVTTGVKDLTGIALSAQKTWSFTTVYAPDTTAPIVVSKSPASGASSVPVSATVSAIFSKALNSASVNSLSFKLLSGASLVDGSVSYNGTTYTATFTPNPQLDPGATYTAALLPTITDTSGNHLAATNQWQFTTASGGTLPTPTVSETTPADGDTNVPILTAISVLFSQAMDSTTIGNTTYYLKRGTVTIPASVSYNPVHYRATLIPASPLALNTVYTATVTTGIKAATGLALPSPVTWSFTTMPPPPYTINCTLNGAAAGYIESTPEGLYCSGTQCSGSFTPGSSVTLHAVADESSFFTSWGGACSGSGDCKLVLNSSATVIANFDRMPARIASDTPVYFMTLSNAYANANNGDTIEMRSYTFVENPAMQQAKVVAIKGGFDSGYATQTGDTVIQGVLTIGGSGSVTADRIIMK